MASSLHNFAEFAQTAMAWHFRLKVVKPIKALGPASKPTCAR